MEQERELTTEELAEARRYALSIAWSPEDEVFIVSVPDLPGVVTHGATREEAAAMGDEMVATWIAARRRWGFQVPPPVTARDVTFEAPPPYDAARIRRVRNELGVSQDVFASLLNVSANTIRGWEQGLRRPDGASARLLAIAERHPDVLAETARLRTRGRRRVQRHDQTDRTRSIASKAGKTGRQTRGHQPTGVEH